MCLKRATPILDSEIHAAATPEDGKSVREQLLDYIKQQEEIAAKGVHEDLTRVAPEESHDLKHVGRAGEVGVEASGDVRRAQAGGCWRVPTRDCLGLNDKKGPKGQ